jgi:hypothetical protein
MVEVAISLVVLCGGSRDGYLLSLWVFVGGFHSVFPCCLSPHSYDNQTQLYLVLWGCFVCFEPPFGHCISFSPGHGIILRYWYPHSGYEVDIMQRHSLGFLVVPGLCISINIIQLFRKNMRVMPLRVLGVGYWPVINIFSFASWSTLPGVELLPYLTRKRL